MLRLIPNWVPLIQTGGSGMRWGNLATRRVVITSKVAGLVRAVGSTPPSYYRLLSTRPDPNSTSPPTKSPLTESLTNLPNLLTLSRIGATPLLGYLIVQEQYPAALGLFVVAGVTDLLDGWIARKYNLQTVVGSVLDPLADKILMTTLVISLSWNSLIPAPLAWLILGRDGGLLLASFYIRYISLPPPKTFLRYWNFQLPSAEVHPTLISKLNTFLQLGLVGTTLLDAAVPLLGLPPLLLPLQYIVATTTIGSGLSYCFSKDAVKILPTPK